MHENVFAGKLPDKLNVVYAPGAEIMDEDGGVEDTVVPLDLAFDSIGLRLNPCGQHELQVHLGELGPGEYRVVKPFRAEGLDLTAELAAAFFIE